MRFLKFAAMMLVAAPLQAANPDRARQAVMLVYDKPLYTFELDRIMGQADAVGLFHGTAAERARSHAATRNALIAQRDLVLQATTTTVAERATDLQIDSLLQLLRTAGDRPNAAVVEGAFATVKSSFTEAMWDQLIRTVRNDPNCVRDVQGRCL